MASKVFPVVVVGVLASAAVSSALANYSIVTVDYQGDQALDSTGDGFCTLREAVGTFNKTNKTKNTDCSIDAVEVTTSESHPNEIHVPYALLSPSVPTISLTAALGAIDVSPAAPLHIMGSIYKSNGVYLQAAVSTVVRPSCVVDDSNTDSTLVNCSNLTSLTDAIFNVSGADASIPVEISHFNLWRGAGADGGAIKTVQALTLTQIEIRDSVATGSGAAIYSTAPSLTVNGAYIYDNKSNGTVGAAKQGAAIVQMGGTLTLDKAMIASNISKAGAAGVYAENASLDINFSTIAQNATSDASASAAGLVQTGSKNVIMSNSVLAENTLPSSADSACAVDATATITSLYNAFSQIDPSSCGFVAAEGSAQTSLVGESPLLGPLVRFFANDTIVTKITSPYKDSKLINAAAPTGHASGRGCKVSVQDADKNFISYATVDLRGTPRLSSEKIDNVCGVKPSDTSSSSYLSWSYCEQLHAAKGDRCDIGAIESRGAPISLEGSLHLFRPSAVDFDPTLDTYYSESVADVTSPDSLSVTSQPQFGKAEVVAVTDSESNISYKIRYTPNADFKGDDSIGYSVKDYNGYDITTKINIQVDGDESPKSGGAMAGFGLLLLAGLTWRRSRRQA